MRRFERPDPLPQPVHQLQIIPLRNKAGADLGNQVVPDADISIYDFFLLVHCDNLSIHDQDICHLHRPPCLMQFIAAPNAKRPQKYAWAYFRSQKFTVPGRDP
ncbi:hypothetical protein D3C75_1064550 [compost metagenome]